MNYRNDEVREIAAAYLATTDDDARAAMRKTFTAALHEDMPVLPLLWTPLVVAVAKSVTGFEVDPYEMRYGLENVTV